VIQEKTRTAYRLWRENPNHPGLRFKQAVPGKLVFSLRIDKRYRAFCVFESGSAVWFWIGKHAEYERILKAFRQGS